MKKTLYFCICVLISVCVISFLPSCEDLSVYDEVIRLHILANSNSEADQELKIFVRDKILSEIGEIVDGAKTKEEAEAAIAASLGAISDIASSAVTEYGSDAPVSVTLSEERYPRKSYGTVVLPSGTYTSLRVMIGEAEGANWWCVLFPDICTSPALKKTDGNNTHTASSSEVDISETEEKFVEAGFTPSQYKLITDTKSTRYVIKFRIVEIFNTLFGK